MRHLHPNLDQTRPGQQGRRGRLLLALQGRNRPVIIGHSRRHRCSTGALVAARHGVGHGAGGACVLVEGIWPRVSGTAVASPVHLTLTLTPSCHPTNPYHPTTYVRHMLQGLYLFALQALVLAVVFGKALHNNQVEQSLPTHA